MSIDRISRDLNALRARIEVLEEKAKKADKADEPKKADKADKPKKADKAKKEEGQ